MDYLDCCCPPDFETFMSWTLSIKNEEKEVTICQRVETTKEYAPSFQVK